MGATPEGRPERRDPLDEERDRARDTSEGTEPIPGTNPDEAAADDVPAHPSLGSPPRRDRSRPVFRSSQLQDGGDPEDGRLRG